EDLALGETQVLQRQWQSLQADAVAWLPFWPAVKQGLPEALKAWPLRKLEFVRRVSSQNSAVPHLVFLLLYSALLDADKHAAVIGLTPARGVIDEKFVDKARRNLGFDQPSRTIDLLRNELYQTVMAEAEVLTIRSRSECMLSLTAPTGSGKTLAVLSAALRLRERMRQATGRTPRIIYALPFLAIIDQNARVIMNSFTSAAGEAPDSSQVLIHHHLTDLSYRQDENEFDPDAAEILIEGWDSEIIITTFVQLFHSIFTNRNRALRRFHRLAGSIVVLDEVQAVPAKYWALFQETAENMARLFGTCFILTTATQPAIFERPRELVTDRQRFFAALNRYELRPRIQKSETIGDFASRLALDLEYDRRSTLVVVNTIACAEELYRQLAPRVKSAEFDPYYLSAMVVPAQRLERIEAIRRRWDSRRKLVVSTQLVEAGVDIDLERVIRDIGPLDSIVQVAGRANRGMQSQRADVEIVNLQDDRVQPARAFSSYIYDRWLLQPTEGLLRERKTLAENELPAFVEDYFRKVKERVSSDESQELLRACKKLEFDRIGEFELIEEPQEKVDIFVELDDDATRVWQEYEKLQDIKDRFERRRAFQQLRGRFYKYVVSIALRKSRANLPPEVHGIRFIGKLCLDEYYDRQTGFKTRAGVSLY
ncbi:MAG: CRISPR-associated helicase Cas3', partial [candidate division WOR-3 bacterium]